MTVHTSKSLSGSIYPAFWGADFAAYRNAGGLILARIGDGWSCYLQPGDDSAEMSALIDSGEGLDDDDSDALVTVFDHIASEYAGVMVAPGEAGGRPSSDGGFWYWLRQDGADARRYG
jgi:hypothetical protein